MTRCAGKRADQGLIGYERHLLDLNERTYPTQVGAPELCPRTDNHFQSSRPHKFTGYLTSGRFTNMLVMSEFVVTSKRLTLNNEVLQMTNPNENIQQNQGSDQKPGQQQGGQRTPGQQQGGQDKPGQQQGGGGQQKPGQQQQQPGQGGQQGGQGGQQKPGQQSGQR